MDTVWQIIIIIQHSTIMWIPTLISKWWSQSCFLPLRCRSSLNRLTALLQEWAVLKSKLIQQLKVWVSPSARRTSLIRKWTTLHLLPSRLVGLLIPRLFLQPHRMLSLCHPTQSITALALASIRINPEIISNASHHLQLLSQMWMPTFSTSSSGSSSHCLSCMDPITSSSSNNNNTSRC